MCNINHNHISQNQQMNLLSENILIYNNFDSMGINDNILRGIYSYGFENPSSVQQNCPYNRES